MKAKKAVKRLAKVEAILSNVIDQYASENGVRKMLDLAKASVVRAKETVGIEGSPKPVKKPPVKAKESKRRISAEGRRRLSLAAKKRWAIARRSRNGAANGQPLSKTA